MAPTRLSFGLRATSPARRDEARAAPSPPRVLVLLARTSYEQGGVTSMTPLAAQPPTSIPHAPFAGELEAALTSLRRAALRLMQEAEPIVDLNPAAAAAAELRASEGSSARSVWNGGAWPRCSRLP